jgi:SAM-dependent methyltransferase
MLCQNSDTYSVISFLKQFLPRSARHWLSVQKLKARRSMLPLDRLTDFSRLRRLTPYRPAFGWFRGECIDRVYIELFLSRNAQRIKGHCLEIGESQYMDRFGADQIIDADVLDVLLRPGVTILADLTDAPAIPSNSYDCIICTQVLMCIYDVQAAVQTIFRILAPGGVALVTLAGISQIAPPTMMAEGGEFWRFTRSSAQRLFTDVFGAENVFVESFGNVLAATAFLHGLVAEELTAEELAYNDPDYPLTITVSAVKLAENQSSLNA